MTDGSDKRDVKPGRPARGAESSSSGNDETELMTPPSSESAASGVDAPAALGVRYDILGELGAGGMGIVYKARDRETREIVAVKVLKPEIMKDPALQERFLNEVRLARKITHKNVCRIYEFNRLGGTACISMEFVEGENLRTVLDRFGGLPLRKGVEFGQQICAGLSEAHSQGVIHRDLKPENIMVDSDGNVKIMDFGIARSQDSDATATGAAIGTPAYMTPEQVEGRPVDPRTDVYALGLILYEIFTGTRAFSGDTPLVIALKQLREAPTPPRQLEKLLPVGMERIILRCLEKDPARRFQSMEELSAVLTKTDWDVPTAVPVSATTPAPTPAVMPQPKEEKKSRRWLIWVPLAVLALLFVFSGLQRMASRRTSIPATTPNPTAAEPAQQPAVTPQNTAPPPPTSSIPSTDTSQRQTDTTPLPSRQRDSSPAVSTTSPTQLRQQLQRARQAMRRGNLQEAAHIFEDIHNQYPNNQQAATMLTNLRKLAEVQHDPVKKQAVIQEWGRRAERLIRQGKREEARSLLEGILALDPSNQDARRAMNRLRNLSKDSRRRR